MTIVKAKGLNIKVLKEIRINSMYEIDYIANKFDKEPEDILSWEKGDSTPTYKQLSTLSEIYRCPSALFFGETVPEKEELPADYRIMPTRSIDSIPIITNEIYNAAEKHEACVDLSKKLDMDIEKFELKCDLEDDSKIIANELRKYIGIPIKEQFKWKNEDNYFAFNKWRERLEEMGIVILKFTGISPKEVRGFSIAKHPFPIIGINTKDSPKARIFTIFHELTHIMLGKSGVCDLRNRDSRTERFCDEVSANFLIPEKNLLNDESVLKKEDEEWEDQEIMGLAKKFSVSKEAMLLALIDIKKADWEFYWRKKRQWERENDRNNDTPSGGPPYHKRILSNNGSLYTDILFNAYDNKIITRNEFSTYLDDIKWNHIEKMRG